MAASECDALLGRLMDALEDEDATEARSLLRSARREQCLDKGTSGAMVRAVGKGDFGRAREDLDRAVQLGDLRPQRDQPRLGEGGDRERRRTTRGSRAENPEQGQTQFGEGGDLEGQERLGGGFAGPRGDDDDDDAGDRSSGRRRQRRRSRRDRDVGARSLREFAQTPEDVRRRNRQRLRLEALLRQYSAEELVDAFAERDDPRDPVVRPDAVDTLNDIAGKGGWSAREFGEVIREVADESDSR